MLNEKPTTEIMAGILAKKAAKAKSRTSENYIEGYRDALIHATADPMPAEVDLLVGVTAEVAKERERATAEASMVTARGEE